MFWGWDWRKMSDGELAQRLADAEAGKSEWAARIVSAERANDRSALERARREYRSHHNRARDIEKEIERRRRG